MEISEKSKDKSIYKNATRYVTELSGVLSYSDNLYSV